jgi:hypothetical protein
VRHLFITAALFIASTPANAGDVVWVTVAGSTSNIRQGDAPMFFVTVTNDASAPARVIRVEGDWEYQREYYQLVVTKGGQAMWRTESCDRRGPSSKKDYVALAPHQAYSFTLSNYTWLFKRLKPGEYEVAVRYSHWTGPELCYASESNRVPLTISP